MLTLTSRISLEPTINLIVEESSWGKKQKNTHLQGVQAQKVHPVRLSSPEISVLTPASPLFDLLFEQFLKRFFENQIESLFCFFF